MQVVSPVKVDARIRNEKDPLWLTRRERHQYFFEVIKAFAAVSFFISLLSFAETVAIRSHDMETKRREEALRLLRQWDERFSKDRKEILEMWRALEGPTTPLDQMSQERAKRLWSAADPDSVWSGSKLESELGSKLVAVLNFLETISVAVQTNAADAALMKGSVRTPLLQWRTRLRPFTDAADEATTLKETKQQGRHVAVEVWEPFYKLADRWAAQIRQPAPPARFPKWVFGTRP